MIYNIHSYHAQGVSTNYSVVHVQCIRLLYYPSNFPSAPLNGFTSSVLDCRQNQRENGKLIYGVLCKWYTYCRVMAL